MFTRRPFVFSLALALLATDAAADCVGSKLDPLNVAAIAHAPTVQALDSAFKIHGGRDPALYALYRRQRLFLNPTRSEELRYLRGLPRSENELDQVYSLINTTGFCDDPATQRTVYEMFDVAGYLMYRHGVFHRRFIELTAWSNAEVGELAARIYEWLLINDAKLTVEALRRTRRDVRMRFCGGRDPRDLSVREAASLCAGEMGPEKPTYER